MSKRIEGVVTVCDRCLQASCWQGKFMCEESRFAGTVDLPLGTLARLDLENPGYWMEQEGKPNKPEAGKGE